MTTENTRKALQNGARESGIGSGYPYSCASTGIEANPSLLLEAMVEDGMLRAVLRYEGQSARYEVIPPEPPHVHEWKFAYANIGAASDHRRAYWSCRSCPGEATTDIVPPA